MFLVVSEVLKKVGVDRAIAYTVCARIIQAAGGFATVFCIALYLTKLEQGYYYTFSSILTIQIFFELGLNTIITQYVAHEMATLELKDDLTIQGDEIAGSRLAHLLRLCVKWFSIIGFMLFLILLVIGSYFFMHFNNHSQVSWQGPWIILSVTTGGFFLVDPILAFIEGMGKVTDIAQYRLYQQITYMVFVVIFLFMGLNLYAPALAGLISFVVVVINLLISKHKKMLLLIWKQAAQWRMSYWKEIFPYQWKIALSWISGYFIYEFFNPVIFATDGAVIAGQMGMTLAALSGIASLAGSWINTKIPLFSNLIAKGQYDELDNRFNRACFQSLFITILGLAALFITVTTLQYNNIEVGKRFLPIRPLICLIFIAFINQINYSLTAYLRCHKAEPLLVQTVITGILGCLSTFILGHLYGVTGITAGYLVIVSVGLPWTYFVFKTKKKQWHLPKSILNIPDLT
jgi:O-antigen/teichoic acid export membrane protein